MTSLVQPLSNKAELSVVNRPYAARTKEPAHLPLHRRLLFPTYPIDKPLPPILIGETRDLSVINERLYHLIALTLRAYVLFWYPRFSKDKSFLPTLSSRIIVPILSPILTGLYTNPDRLISFLLFDLPSVLVLHWRTYWQSRQAISDYPHLYPSERLDAIYHARLPRLSVIPSPGVPEIPKDGDIPYRRPTPAGQYTLSPLYLTSLSDALLRLHLPPEEYGCEVERIMAKEILGRMVLGGVGRKLGEGWFWWTMISRLLSHDASGTAESGVGHNGRIDIVWRAIMRLCALALVAWSTLISILARYSAAPPSKAKYVNCGQAWMTLMREVLGVDGRNGLTPTRWAMRLAWAVVEGMIVLLQPFIDRLLPHMISSALTQDTALRLIDLIERLLFPLDGYPGPSPPDLTDKEAESARKLLEERLRQLIPGPVQGILFPAPDDIRSLFGPLEDSGCNAHLVGMLLDGIVATLEPGLVSTALTETLTDRYSPSMPGEQGVQAPDIDLVV